MKSKILLAVIGTAGLAGLTDTSYGQGQIFFDNYDSIPYASNPVVYGGTNQGVPPSLAGTLAGSNVNVELGYFIGTTSDPYQMTLVPSSMTAVNGTTPGFFEGPLVTIPGYTSGPVTFEILAWTQDYHYNNLDGFGFFSFYIWTEPSIAPVPEPAGFFTSLPGNIYLYLDVPEPTTPALAGLGALVSLVMLRHQHS